MPTPEQIKEAARRRKANQRARDKGLPEPYPTVDRDAEETQKSKREQDHIQNLAYAMELDGTGRFYKSECRSAVSLLAIYEGNNDVGVEDPEVIDPKTGKKKHNIPNPSMQAIRVRAIETVVDGTVVKIDPDMLEYKSLYEVNHVVSFKEWLELRDKGRRNLFWVSHVMGKSLFHNTHQMICDKFVKKNFDNLYFPDFGRSDVGEMLRRQVRFADDGVTPTRTLLLMAPRSGWKSTIDGIDAVQWMLNAPDVRIMIVTAFRKLAKLFLREIKNYFYLPPRGQASAFQLLYPEYVLTGIDGRSAEPIRCPAATMDSKEPHLWITSMESSATGMRCDICKADDIVDPKNSNNEDLRQNLQSEFNGLTDLVERAWGFIDIIGTRYFTNDYYGMRMMPDEQGNISPFSSLVISAWTPKPQFVAKYEQLLQDPNGMSQVTEDMVDIWFPFKLNYQTLRDMLLAKKERGTSNIQKERSFRNQQLNIATDPMEESDFAVHFTRDILRSHTYPAPAAPTTGENIVTVDWSYSDNKGSDYSVFANILHHIRDDNTHELVVKDLEFDKWKATDVAFKLVMFLRKHRPMRTFIEKSNGHDLLLAAMVAYARKYDCLDALNNIFWVETGNEPRAKANRIKTLEILLADDRLHFVGGPWIDELYRQFERFTGETKKGRKDDIPDAISQGSRVLPQNMFTNIKVDPEEEKRIKDKQDKELEKVRNYQRIFGTQFSGTISKPGAPNLPAPTWRQWLKGETGEPIPEPEPEQPPKPMDPRMRIFGNKGPWRL